MFYLFLFIRVNYRMYDPSISCCTTMWETHSKEGSSPYLEYEAIWAPDAAPSWGSHV